jgi:pimeloyl-ACP methyl ester carboxylesterase
LIGGVTRFASYDGTLLSYTEVGTGPRLVCLPGGPGRAAEYMEELGGLSATRTLVLLDSRGTGHSELPADPATLRFDRLAADVESLREHLGEERVDLLGHSAGCLVVQAWLAAHADRAQRVVLVTPGHGLQGGDRADLPGIRASRAEEPWYADAAQAVDALADAPPAQQQALIRATRPFFYGRWDERTQAHAATADRQSSKRAQLGFGVHDPGVDRAGIRSALACVKAPVLVLGGERDALTGVDIVHDVAESFPSVRTVVLPRAGHFPWVDEPAAFAAVVSDFLTD